MLILSLFYPVQENMFLMDTGMTPSVCTMYSPIPAAFV